MVRIAPSILSADYGDLHAEIARVKAGVDLLHVDVMDGHFVPNITIGAPVVGAIRKKTDLFFDCHLMIEKPGDYLEAFAKAGADSCSVHVEVGNTKALIDLAHSLGMQAGLVVNPSTPIEAFEEYLGSLDMIVLMTVNPGFGGQSFMTDVMPKLANTRRLVNERKLHVAIEVDGGIDASTAPIAVENGADTLVAGNAIYGEADPLEAAGQLREIAQRAARQSQ